MAYHVIYFIVGLTYGIWALALAYRNVPLAIFSSLMMFPLSVFIFSNGMDIFNNLLTQMFAGITFGIAAFTSLNAAIEMFEGKE